MSQHAFDSGLVWFRRDLRAHDNAALAAALAGCRRVHAVFVFDSEILEPLPRRDRRVAFIHAALVRLDRALRARGGGLIVRHGRARDEVPRLAAELAAGAVFAGREHEPYTRERDEAVGAALASFGARLHTVRDHLVFGPEEILNASGRPYAVFTPYRKAWYARLEHEAQARLSLREAPSDAGRLAPTKSAPLPTLEALGFEPVDVPDAPGDAYEAQALLDAFADRIADYPLARDQPAAAATSQLSVHLRFGTVSTRAAARLAWQLIHSDPARAEGARSWLSELVWREFFVQVLHHHPRVVAESFHRDYEALRWDDAPDLLAAWREARTGYPLVDAAMAQISATGFMHNRLRMVAASFLVKDLGIDWRVGERWFAEHLLDYELSSNNGNWQWVASTGCDATPWFRIFNPVTQSRRFDPHGRFIRRWLPRLARFPDRTIHAPWLASPEEQQRAGCVIGRDYPAPVVDHDAARRRTLARYRAVRPAAVARPDQQGEPDGRGACR